MNKSFNLSDYEEAIRLVLDSEGEFRIYPRGTSMLPLLREKKDSVVLIKPVGPIKKHEIILFKKSSGQYTLHRVIAIEKDSYTTCGDNLHKPEYNVKPEQIIGIVNKIYRNDKLFNTKKMPYRIYLFILRIKKLIYIFIKLLRILKNRIVINRTKCNRPSDKNKN